MPFWLIAITFAVFVFYTDDYMIAGVLPELAADLGISESTAGQLVSAYSLVLVLGAPMIAFASARRSRLGVFVGASIVFTIANLLAAVVDSFWQLMILRVVAAGAAAACLPAMFALAPTLAPPEKRSAYIGIVSTGIVGALAIGVPFGTLCASIFSWRGNFVAFAGLSVLSMVLLFCVRGRLRVPGELVSAKTHLSALSSRPVLTVLLGNTILLGGALMMFTYFGPFAADFSNSSLRQRGLLFAVAGIAGLIGSVAGGIYVDKKGASTALRIGFGLFLSTMIVFAILTAFAPISMVVLVALTLVWSFSLYWNTPAMQTMLLDAAPDSATQVLALNSSSTYLGVTLGSIAGGITLAVFSPFALPIAAAALSAVALLVIEVLGRRAPATERLQHDSAERTIS
ncbi:MFS transporter [Nocardia colli]|uniref:MFS transporter n=1 Tax=Nocardia colli TaxID=2545717 RepID=A0A5N0EHP8_9NOCA|nr:MFS transporter [Nocardia colli]KAA8888918.1 MFS transporter [Nocardia colli]